MLDPSFLDPSNANDKATIKIKQKSDMGMAYITMAFETNAAMNHLNKYKSADWPKELAGKLLEKLRKWA